METPKKERANKKVAFFRVNYGSIGRDMVAVYDKRDISDIEALSLIKADEYSPKIIVITKAQFDNVFRDIIEYTGKEG